MSKYRFLGFWVKNSGLMISGEWMITGCHDADFLVYRLLS